MITWIKNLFFGKPAVEPAPVAEPMTTEVKNARRRAATEKLVAKTKAPKAPKAPKATAPKKPRNTKKVK